MSRAIVTLSELDSAGDYKKVIIEGVDLADETNRQQLTRFYKKQTTYRTRTVVRMIRTELIRDIEFEEDEQVQQVPPPSRRRTATPLKRRTSPTAPDDLIEEVEPEDDEDEEDEGPLEDDYK
jgi:hypothetical protein